MTVRSAVHLAYRVVRYELRLYASLARWVFRRPSIPAGHTPVGYELRLYASLARWVFRRPSIPAGHTPVGYARAVTPVMSLWIFASAMEVPLFHVLVPWHSVRIAGLAVGIWGLVWMLGLLASLRVFPHLTTASTLRVRNGASVDIVVPWDAVQSIAVRRADLPSSVRTLQPEQTDEGTHLRVGVSGQVNVNARLTGPLTVRTPHGPQRIVELSFLVDDPRAFVRDAQSRVVSPTRR